MQIGKKIASVAKRSASFAKWVGITRIKPIRQFGVRIMESVVPSEAVTITVRDDIRIRLNPEEDGRWYYFEDEDVWWGSGSDAWVENELEPGDTFLDIGAHIGYFSLLARDIVGETGEVIAFEPHPSSYSKLRENIELNGFNNVRTERLAAAEDSGIITLYEGDKTIRATIVKESGVGRQAAKVETVALDDYFNASNITPDIIKINAEGAEYSILRGMKKMIASSQPTIGVEVHPNHLDKHGSSCEAFLQTLYEHEYTLFSMATDNRMTRNDIINTCKQHDEPFRIIARPNGA